MESPTDKSGTLSRANRLILGESNNISVFSLEHWSHQIDQPDSSSPARPKNRKSNTTTRAKIVGFKIHETVLNFLLRWLINHQEDPTRPTNDNNNYNNNGSQRVSFEDVPVNSNFKSGIDSSPWLRHATKQRRITRSSLLLTNANNLSDRRLKTVLKFVFWRWFTWTNVFEFVLIILLICCCIYQCFELLEEYYQYPTHVSIRKIMNDDFYQDLPGITFCNANRVSKETLANNYPQLNDTHFIAITQGTFYSVDNFTVNLNKVLDYGYLPDKDDPFSKRMEMTELEKYIDWKIVGPFLANGTVAGLFNTLPTYDIFDSITCANIWGEQLPCQKLRRIENTQQSTSCFTLFHRTVLSNTSDPASGELKMAIENQAKIVSFGKYGSITNGSLLLDGDDDVIDGEEYSRSPSSSSSETIDEASREQTRQVSGDDSVIHDMKQELSPLISHHENAHEPDETKVRVEMGHMEVLRIRIDFRRHDYKNKRLLINGKLSIHSNSVLGSMRHIAYTIRPGFWYNYYVQRFDYRRLPPPYSTKCFEYHEKNQVKLPLTDIELEELDELIEKQAKNPSKLIKRYGQLLRHRSLGGRECYNICKADLSSAKCKCWKWMLYPRAYGGKLRRLCDNDYLLQNFPTNGSKATGDNLHFQLCLKDYYSICFEACPDECRFSSFDITQQSRSWPSEESQRYLKDISLLNRLQEEAECCATISVTYSSPVSSLHATEPKYTRQDMVTIISGNIEAWIGISAVHAYLFMEQLYDALLEAQLIRPIGRGRGFGRIRLVWCCLFPTSSSNDNTAEWRRSIWSSSSIIIMRLLRTTMMMFVSIGNFLISILTKFRAKIMRPTIMGGLSSSSSR